MEWFVQGVEGLDTSKKTEIDSNPPPWFLKTAPLILTAGREDRPVIKVSLFYSNEEGKTFNMDYYFNKHLPMVRQKLGTACKCVDAEQGLSGILPGTPASPFFDPTH